MLLIGQRCGGDGVILQDISNTSVETSATRGLLRIGHVTSPVGLRHYEGLEISVRLAAVWRT